MFFMRKKQSEEARKRFEHKIYVAKECQDDVFDLSHCELSEIPDSIGPLFRVMRKKKLLLSYNMIKSLTPHLKMADLALATNIDLHDNKLKELPNDLHRLSQLKVIDLSNNRLNTLPDSFKFLTSLVKLNLDDNKLSEFPVVICDCTSLQSLRLTGNSFSTLPTNFHRLTKLVDLHLPIDNMKSPDTVTCQAGIQAIMTELCEKAGLRWEDICGTQDEPDIGQIDLSEADSHHLSIEQIKEERTNRLREAERLFSESARQQQTLLTNAEKRRNEQMHFLREEDVKTRNGMQHLNALRASQRSKMVNFLLNAEQSADELIRRLTAEQKKEELVEKTKRRREEDEMESWLRERHQADYQLRRNEVLAAMQDVLLADEQAYQKIWNDLAKTRAPADKACRGDGLLSAEQTEELLSRRSTDKSHLMSRIADEEASQRQAFASLQLLKDTQTQQLRHDIQSVEQELLKLTLAEQERRQGDAQWNEAMMNQRRSELLALFERLSKQKDERQNLLRQRLVEMDRAKHQDEVDFWLIQYQRLLDRMPEELDREQFPLDPMVAKIIGLVEGADAFTVFFQRGQVDWPQLTRMSDDDLRRMGIYASGIRQRILEVVRQKSKLEAPSAPTAKQEPKAETSASPEPSAPPEPSIIDTFMQSECIICMDRRCTIIFVPCGHVCSCDQCCASVQACPLCRALIEQRVRIGSTP